MLFITDRYALTPVARKKQPQYVDIRVSGSYYMWMVSAVVPVKAPRSGSGSGTGVPIRHLRSSHPSGLPVVKILHHRQPSDRRAFRVPARCSHRGVTWDLHGGASVAPPLTVDGGENFPPPWPEARSCKFCGTAAVAQRSRKFSGPVDPPWLMARWCRFDTTVLGGTVAGRHQLCAKLSRTVRPGLLPPTARRAGGQRVRTFCGSVLLTGSSTSCWFIAQALDPEGRARAGAEARRVDRGRAGLPAAVAPPATPDPAPQRPVAVGGK